MKSIVGIDVGKYELVIQMEKNSFSIENSKESFSAWLTANEKEVSNVSLFAYEPTGGYEKILAQVLREKNLPHSRVHANHVRSYAKAMGRLAKTDAIDAKTIADFALAKKVQAITQHNPHEDLIARGSRRKQLIAMKKQEANRLETLSNSIVEKQIKAHIIDLKDKISDIDKAIKNYVASDVKVSETIGNACSIPGVGNITATTVLAYLPELPTASPKQIAALAGLAPMNKDSGTQQGQRSIYGGRSAVRGVLYMAAITAIQHNPSIKQFYNRLRKRGKQFKVAITAVMRKLLIMIQSVVKRNTVWMNEDDLAAQRAAKKRAAREGAAATVSTS